MDFASAKIIVKYFDDEEGYEKLSHAHHLDKDLSKTDPQTEPFKSMYAARKIWQEIRDELYERCHDGGTADDFLKCTLSALDFKIGVNFVETEENHSGEELLINILDTIEHLKDDELGVAIYSRTLNYLGFLYSTRSEDEALNYLLKAERLYFTFKRQTDKAPWRFSDFLSKFNENEDLQKERVENMEDIFTHTLYYIAQVYANMDKKKESALYCSKTLKRQLDSKKYEPEDWSLNAAALSQYFVNSGNFSIARHCLAGASFIFNEILSEMNEDMSENHIEHIMLNKGEIERCWIKYGITLLQTSRDRLMADVDLVNTSDTDSEQVLSSLLNDINDSHQQSDPDNIPTANIESHDLESIPQKSMLFNLELTSLEEKISCQYVLDFSDARNVFLVVQQWINAALDIFTLNEHCSDHIEVVQDYSRLFKFVAFFEPDMERQCRMEKRRIDMLTELLHSLNCNAWLYECRQIMYELAETYSTIMDLKIAVATASNSQANVHALNKINHLAKFSIKYFNMYLDSVKNGKPELPSELSEDDVKPVLISFFHLGRLHSKIITNDNNEKLELVRKSLACYEFVVKYCQEHSSAKDLICTELSVANEMLTLLPLKIQRLVSGSMDD